MEIIKEMVTLLNNFDNTEKDYDKLRDLVCYISDNQKYRDDKLYQQLIFDAAQKMRTFGYIKGKDKIYIDNLSKNGLYAVAQNNIQEYHKSESYNNTWLDAKQKEIINTFTSLKKKRLLVSAPTSFGKTFLLREIIFLNRERYNNVVMVFPTVALLNENTETIEDFIKLKNLEYEIVNNVYTEIDETKKHIFILTPERTLKILSDNANIKIDFFFFDEVYKIDNVISNNTKIDSLEYDRSSAFRIVLYLLSLLVDEYYIAGPYIKINDLKQGFKRFIEINDITVKEVTFEPTMRIEVDAYQKKAIEHHPIEGEREVSVIERSGVNEKEKIKSIITFVNNNKIGKTLIYCYSPKKTVNHLKDILDQLPDNSKAMDSHRIFINHLKKRYGVKWNNDTNLSEYWNFIKILEKGYAVHHGKMPKYVQKYMLKIFNDSNVNFMLCTSTIIEGVNTNACNMAIVSNQVGGKTMTSFDLKNIRGRAGRYYKHYVGRVFYMHKKQREIQNDIVGLDFPTFNDSMISDIDLDNTDIEHLIGDNNRRKDLRQHKYDFKTLPEDIFTQNRLFDRISQQNYIRHLGIHNNFSKFKRLIVNCNINYFLKNKVLEQILVSLAEIGVIKEFEPKYFCGVAGQYSRNGFTELLKYQVREDIKKHLDYKQNMDNHYMTSFTQVRDIMEFQIPRYLGLFESCFKQACRNRGINSDGFDMTSIIRFYELGVKSKLGMELIDYGFPVDAIKIIEKSFSNIIEMEAGQAKQIILRNKIPLTVAGIDEFEWSLLERAFQKISD